VLRWDLDEQALIDDQTATSTSVRVSTRFQRVCTASEQVPDILSGHATSESRALDLLPPKLRMRTPISVGLWLSCAAQLDKFGVIFVSDLDGIMMKSHYSPPRHGSVLSRPS